MGNVYYSALDYKIGFSLSQENFVPTADYSLLKQKDKKIGVIGGYDSRDFYYNPSKGINTDFRYYYIFSEVGSQKYKKKSIEIKYSQYKKLWQSSVFMFNIANKKIDGRGISSRDLFSFGGNSSLRGFNEEQFSGEFIGWVNLEYRYLLSLYSRTYLFSDYGFILSDLKNPSKDLTTMLSSGFGMQIKTRVGLINISYALGYEKNKWKDFLNGLIHFGIVSKF